MSDQVTSFKPADAGHSKQRLRRLCHRQAARDPLIQIVPLDTKAQSLRTRKTLKSHRFTANDVQDLEYSGKKSACGKCCVNRPFVYMSSVTPQC
jgi:hypothetical protein